MGLMSARLSSRANSATDTFQRCVLVLLLILGSCSSVEGIGQDAGTAQRGTPTVSGDSTTAVVTSPKDESLPGWPDVATSTVLDCTSAIGSSSSFPPTGYESVGDVVALPTSAEATSALQTSRVGKPGSGTRLYAKVGLLVRVGSRFELSVAPGLRDQFAIGWGAPAIPARQMHVGPCDSGSAWLAFAGGFWVKSVGCFDLDVNIDGSYTRVQVGIGAPCPGQDPPNGPSET